MASINPERLHRVHAAPSKGNSCDIGGNRVRMDGTDFGEKKAIAYRIALCWNLCEGWPTDVLEEGALRDVDVAAGLLIKTLKKEQLSPEGKAALDKLVAAYAKRDPLLDMTDGRPADCNGCYPLKKTTTDEAALAMEYDEAPELEEPKPKPKRGRKPKNGDLFADEEK